MITGTYVDQETKQATSIRNKNILDHDLRSQEAERLDEQLRG